MTNPIKCLHDELNALVLRYQSEHQVCVQHVSVDWTSHCVMGLGWSHQLHGIRIETSSDKMA